MVMTTSNIGKKIKSSTLEDLGYVNNIDINVQMKKSVVSLIKI